LIKAPRKCCIAQIFIKLKKFIYLPICWWWLLARKILAKEKINFVKTIVQWFLYSNVTFTKFLHCAIYCFFTIFMTNSVKSSSVWKHYLVDLFHEIFFKSVNWKAEILLSLIFFRQINWQLFSDLRTSYTVWKSTQKHYHAEKFSVKTHNKNLLILHWQMHVFLSLGSNYGSNGLNRFWTLVHMLESLLKWIFLK